MTQGKCYSSVVGNELEICVPYQKRGPNILIPKWERLGLILELLRRSTVLSKRSEGAKPVSTASEAVSVLQHRGGLHQSLTMLTG